MPHGQAKRAAEVQHRSLRGRLSGRGEGDVRVPLIERLWNYRGILS